MNYRIHYPDTFPLLEVNLGQGEMIKAESGAMVTMDETVDVEGKLEGGIMKGLGRMLAGEKFSSRHYMQLEVQVPLPLLLHT